MSKKIFNYVYSSWRTDKKFVIAEVEVEEKPKTYVATGRGFEGGGVIRKKSDLGKTLSTYSCWEMVVEEDTKENREVFRQYVINAHKEKEKRREEELQEAQKETKMCESQTDFIKAERN